MNYIRRMAKEDLLDKINNEDIDLGSIDWLKYFHVQGYYNIIHELFDKIDRKRWEAVYCAFREACEYSPNNQVREWLGRHGRLQFHEIEKEISGSEIKEVVPAKRRGRPNIKLELKNPNLDKDRLIEAFRKLINGKSAKEAAPYFVALEKYYCRGVTFSNAKMLGYDHSSQEYSRYRKECLKLNNINDYVRCEREISSNYNSCK